MTFVLLVLCGMIQSFTVQAFLPAAPLFASIRQQKRLLVVPRRLLGVDSWMSKQRVNGCSATWMEVGVKDTDADEYGGDSVRAFLKDHPTLFHISESLFCVCVCFGHIMQCLRFSGWY